MKMHMVSCEAYGAFDSPSLVQDEHSPSISLLCPFVILPSRVGLSSTVVGKSDLCGVVIDVVKIIRCIVQVVYAECSVHDE
jgi:hypothetical protein